MKPCKVLIVEDQLIVQMHLQRIVEEMGHVVTGTATDEATALAAAERDPPELVLMDIHLDSGSDGVDVARRLRGQHDCAVVFVTAYADADTVSRTADVGAAGYVVKPFTDTQVHAAIVTAIVGHALLQQVVARGRALVAALANVGDAVVLTDGRGAVTFVNEGAEALTGWSMAEARDHDVVEVLGCGAPDREATLRAALDRTNGGGRSQRLDGFVVGARDGTEHRATIRVEVVAPSDAAGGMTVFVLRPDTGH